MPAPAHAAPRLSRALGAAVLGASAGPAAAQLPPIPQGDLEVRMQIVTGGLAGAVDGDAQISPTDLTPDGTGRMFVSTLGGVVRVLDASGNLLPAPLLTQAQTNNTPSPIGEWGMTSIAVHPDFNSPGAAGYGKFYTITTEPNAAAAIDFGQNGDHQDVVKEWTLANPAANTWGAPGDTVREVLRVGQPGTPHNTVDLAFDPSGLLHITTGDGGANTFQSQDKSTIFGSVFRIDPLNTAGPSIARAGANGQYGIPDSNPYLADPNALDEAFAFGLRSPYRINPDRLTGRFYIGDVGQSDIEEINRLIEGANYGWNDKEGTFRSGQGNGCCRVEPDIPQRNGGITLVEEFDLTDPVFEYDHGEGVTIIGGFVYRGSLLPELQGKYVFADLGEGLPSARLFYGDLATGDVEEFFIDPDGDTFLGQLGPEAGSQLPLPERIISIGEDENGELYLLGVGIDPRSGGGLDGVVVRLVPEPASASLLALGALGLSRRRR
ncbi:MAG: PQQ-dependent sugar dehydrogenase [Planctomycetota bacterium]